MRALLLASTAATLLFAQPTNAADEPHRSNVMRDCLRNQEIGQHPKERPGATYLYITSVMLADDAGHYGNASAWAVQGSLAKACEYALSNLTETKSVPEGWAITGATAMLVPDDIVKAGLNH